MVRFFCLVAPGEPGDLGYAYLTALLGAGVKVRALSIGPASAMGFETRWWKISTAFVEPLTAPYLNVVCARPGMAMGTRAKIGASGTLDGDGLPSNLPAELKRMLVGRAKEPRAPIEYEPAGVIAGLATVGCKNILIAAATPKPDDAELAAIKAYDLVICPTALDQALFAELGVSAVLISMHSMGAPDGDLRADRGGPHRGLSTLGRTTLVLELERLCEFGTTLTTAPSADTGELPGTILPLSGSASDIPTTSSRSSASITSSGVPKGATTSSTETSSPSTNSPSVLRRTWRSITRLLGFSKPS